MLITTQAIVLSAIKYGEADLIVSCYTRKKGRTTYMLKGVLKSKKAKIRASYFQPLSLLEIEATHKDKGTLDYLKEVKLDHPYQSLHSDMYKSALVLFLSEILKNTIQEEEANQQLYDYITASLMWLDKASEFGNFHIAFLLQLTSYLGFYPDDSQKDKPYFNIAEGYFSDEAETIYSEKGSEVSVLKQFFGTPFDAISAIKLTKSERAGTLNLLLVYYQLHLHGFKKPKSLDVLQQLFS